jgi:hypothetical protein
VGREGRREESGMEILHITCPATGLSDLERQILSECHGEENDMEFCISHVGIPTVTCDMRTDRVGDCDIRKTSERVLKCVLESRLYFSMLLP